MWRHHDEPEETADALGGLLLEALGWLRPEHDKLAVIVEDLEGHRQGSAIARRRCLRGGRSAAGRRRPYLCRRVL